MKLPVALVGIVVFLTTVLGLSVPALACRCASGSPIDKFQAAEVIFWGRALSSKRTKHGITYRFQRGKVYRGSRLSKKVKVATGKSTCAASFEVGRTYVVYAGEGGDAGLLRTSKCSGSYAAKKQPKSVDPAKEQAKIVDVATRERKAEKGLVSQNPDDHHWPTPAPATLTASMNSAFDRAVTLCPDSERFTGVITLHRSSERTMEVSVKAGTNEAATCLKRALENALDPPEIDSKTLVIEFRHYGDTYSKPLFTATPSREEQTKKLNSIPPLPVESPPDASGGPRITNGVQ